jgi:hypothetical protein
MHRPLFIRNGVRVLQAMPIQDGGAAILKRRRLQNTHAVSYK